jgi:hypothetical protein
MSGGEARAKVELLLKQLLGTTELAVDAAGNWPIRWGSAIYFVRAVESPMAPAFVQVFSPLLGGVQKSAGLLEALNDINVQVVFARVAWVNGMVMASTELLAETLDLQELQAACATIAQLADTYDNALQGRFGGQISFPEDAAAAAGGGQSPQPQALTEQEAIMELQKNMETSRMVQNILNSNW